jgi:small subunit ribosomal protein S18
MADENVPRPQAPPSAPAGPPAHAPGPSGPSGHTGPGGYSGSGGPGRFGGPRPQGGRPGGPAKRGKRNFIRKKKVCRFCVDKSDYIDYKKAEILAPFLQERGKILPRRMTGTCARHQRWLAVAIKRAQNIALLPFAAEL